MNRTGAPDPANAFCTVHENASLRERTTFRVDARAATLIDVHDATVTLPQLLRDAESRGLPILVIGGGSNILFTRDWPGVVIALRTRGIDVIESCFANLPGNTALIRVSAGEVWDDFVRWSLAHNFVGLENLALIPGSVGAAPIQNIGAYGTEVGEFVSLVWAYDRRSNEQVSLDRDACAFAYRDSLFKREPGRYVITAVDFLLPRQRALRMDYAGIREELAEMNVVVSDARAVAAAVTRLRTRKLPDPAVVGNAGSFFKNPIVTLSQAQALRAAHPSLTMWPIAQNQAKLSAAWLIEACNFKGLREGNAGVSSTHSLVLVNHGNATGAQIWAFAQRIQQTVQERFGVWLESEPLVI